MKKPQKEILLGFIMLLLGVFSWYFLKYVFYIGNLSITCWVFGVVLFIFWGVSMCLAMLLIDNRKILYGSFILILISFAMFFNNEPFYYLIGLLILFLAFWIDTWKIRREEHVQINLNFWRIWKRGLPILITALVLVISLVYYFSPGLEVLAQKDIRIPRNIFDGVIGGLAPLIEKKLPENMKSLDVEVDRILTPEEIEELEIKYDIILSNNTTTKDLLYELVNYQINGARGPYKKFIPIGFAIALFLALRIVSVFYISLVIILSWAFLRILILLNFVKIEIETKEIETVKL